MAPVVDEVPLDDAGLSVGVLGVSSSAMGARLSVGEFGEFSRVRGEGTDLILAAQNLTADHHAIGVIFPGQNS